MWVSGKAVKVDARPLFFVLGVGESENWCPKGRSEDRDRMLEVSRLVHWVERIRRAGSGRQEDRRAV